MDIILNNLDFKVSGLTTIEEVDELIAEYDLQIESYNLRLQSKSYQTKRSTNRSNDVSDEITNLETKITATQNQLTGLTPGSDDHTKTSLDLETYQLRVKKLKYQNRDTISPVAEVERNADLEEVELLLFYYTKLREALAQRKTELGG